MFPLPLSPEGGINLLIKQIREKDRANSKAFTRQAQLRVLEVVRETALLLEVAALEYQGIPLDAASYNRALSDLLSALDLKEENV